MRLHPLLHEWLGTCGGRGGGGSLFAFLRGTPILLKTYFTAMIKIKHTLLTNHCNFIKIARETTTTFYKKTKKHCAHTSAAGE